MVRQISSNCLKELQDKLKTENQKALDKCFELRIKVITPIFGGSDKPGQVDPFRPISAKSIRGHLRFWWRACVADNYKTSEDLFIAEADIWGGVNVPDGNAKVAKESKVKLTVDILKSGTVSDNRKWQGPLRYALFPFSGNEDTKQNEGAGKCLENVEFQLNIWCPTEIREEVAQALRAWILFGGIGARTRRGCGSLFCVNWSDQLGDFPSNTKELIKKGLPQNCAQQIEPKWPNLFRTRQVIGEPKTPVEAWSDAVGLMQKFRQGVDLDQKQNSSKRRYSKSKWPEADSIRENAKTKCKHTPQGKSLEYYPRADLGLPIVMQFPGCNGCPRSHTIGVGEDANGRMASPIILKPLAISESKAVPLVLLLNTPRVWESKLPIIVKPERGCKYDLQENQINDPSKNKKVEPLKGLDARNAFIKMASEADCWTEVTIP